MNLAKFEALTRKAVVYATYARQTLLLRLFKRSDCRSLIVAAALIMADAEATR
jgi:hypothetical protein